MQSFNIGLLWHSLSSDNLGVVALTESQIAICKAACNRLGIEAHFTVVGTIGSREPERDPYVTVGTPVSIRRTFRGDAAYLSELKHCKVVLDIGEGDSFTDIYGLYRFAFHIVSKLALQQRKIPVVLSPQTIGPFNHFVSRRLSAYAMAHSKRVFARDHASFAYAAKLGVSTVLAEAVDVAFRLPYQARPTAMDGTVHIGLNPSGLLMSGGYEGSNQFGLSLDYRQLIFSLLDDWTSRDDITVWLVPHVMAAGIARDNDMVAVAELAKLYPACRVAPQFKSPSDAKSFISGLEFFTGARMHACIAAISSGIPVVPLAYSRKFNGLFSTLDYPYLADGVKDDQNTAFEKIQNGLRDRTELREAACRSLAIANSRLQVYEDYLVELFSELVKD